MENAWSGNKNRYDEKGSLCASLFLHALLFLVLSTTSDFSLALGNRTQIDLIWLTPSPAASPPRQAAAAAVREGRQPVAERARRRPPAPGHSRVASARSLSPALPALPIDAVSGEVVRLPTGHPPAAEPEAEPVRMTLPTPKANPPLAAGSRPGAAPPAVKKMEAPPPAAPAPGSGAGGTAAALPGEEVSTREEAAPKHVRQEGATRAPAVHPPLQGRETQQAQEPEASTKQLPQAAPATSPAKPPPVTRGMVIASLRGDLKMLISGDGVKLSVAFREYPRSRRNKMPTRSEAKRLQNIAPVSAQREDQTREAVIESAREGVYIFSAEPEQGKPARASFTLKIYEAGTREKVAPLGTRTLLQKTAVAKVLMPEAILWDDDAAFTGSLEDSDCTTKFNAQTGLYWKEYHD